MADAAYLDSVSNALGQNVYGSDASNKSQVEEWVTKVKSGGLQGLKVSCNQCLKYEWLEKGKEIQIR